MVPRVFGLERFHCILIIQVRCIGRVKPQVGLVITFMVLHSALTASLHALPVPNTSLVLLLALLAVALYSLCWLLSYLYAYAQLSYVFGCVCLCNVHMYAPI